jgi:hypothetical protein
VHCAALLALTARGLVLGQLLMGAKPWRNIKVGTSLRSTADAQVARSDMGFIQDNSIVQVVTFMHFLGDMGEIYGVGGVSGAGRGNRRARRSVREVSTRGQGARSVREKDQAAANRDGAVSDGLAA